MNIKQRQAEEIKLLAAIAQELPHLEELLQTVNEHWGFEDLVYRFYHQSFKVFAIQGLTTSIVEKLQGLAPDLALNPWFREIIFEGTENEFVMDMNATWAESTRPMLEAFFHARYFLEMACKYGRELKEGPIRCRAAVLYLYSLR